MVDEKKYTLIMIGFSLVLMIAAISTNDWSVLSRGAVKQSQGLWKVCNNISGKCTKITKTGNPSVKINALKGVQAFSIISCLCLVLAMADILFDTKDTKIQIGLIAGAAVSALIAIVIWISSLNTVGGTKASPGYSYYIAVSSMVMSSIAAFSHWKGKPLFSK